MERRLAREVMDVARFARPPRAMKSGRLPRGLYAYDFVIDIGAYRDLHRHRRCQKFSQPYSGKPGSHDTPKLGAECGAGELYDSAIRRAFETMRRLPRLRRTYLLPFACSPAFCQRWIRRSETSRGCAAA